jgi:hypothetical protein
MKDELREGRSEIRASDKPLERFKATVREQHPLVGEVLDRNAWAYPSLMQFGDIAPKDLKSSLTAATVTANVVKELGETDPQLAFTSEGYDDTVVAATMGDVSRGFLPEDVLYDVYTSGVRWRDDPDAWQREIVERHPEESAKIVEDAGGNDRVKQMVGTHHGLKRNGSYIASDATPVDSVEDLETRIGTAIIVSADVAEAVSKNYAGEGRKKLEDAEFLGRDLAQIVTDEVDVDPIIAMLAAKHTLLVKFAQPSEDLE